MPVELIMLGTGCALVKNCYNTCFALKRGGDFFLVDAGGGNGILRQLDRAGLACGDLRGMFVTHAHTDHILGAVWVVRIIAMNMLGKKYAGDFPVYCHAELAETLETICRLTLPKDHLQFLGTRIPLRVVDDGASADILGLSTVFFDIGSGKDRQFGLRLLLPDGRSLVCLGDEPYNERVRQYVEGCDWLLCEAFCLYAEREIFKPYEKHHSTALDAGRLAAELKVKNLLLYHTEDSNLAERKQRYSAEARTVFSGPALVPDDLEKILL